MEYNEFVKQKIHTGEEYGIQMEYVPEKMFDFQKYVSEKIIRKGRAAAFLDTGLGKTLIELTVAWNYHNHTGKPVLIMTPLSVAYQFIEEARKFGFEGVEYSGTGQHSSPIVLCNYERLSKFNPNDFHCAILDESSILKNFEGQTKVHVTHFLKSMKYRFLFTATPSPNDFVELGTSSEALGYMGYMDMLTKFFRNNEDTISPQSIGAQWVLKGHATERFFDWVSSWSISMRKPSDLGYSDERYVLPGLIVNDHKVKNQSRSVVDGQVMLFNTQARRLTEVRQENRDTIQGRCEKAVELSDGHEFTVYWCNLNDESRIISDIDHEAVELVGSMKLEKKEEILKAFYTKEIKRLITKPKITAFGLNWQHCNHTVYFPTFSYEQYYQAIRRFWRFGQRKPVTVDRVMSDGQQRVIDAIDAKSAKANELFDKLNKSINSRYTETKRNHEPVTLPAFIGE